MEASPVPKENLEKDQREGVVIAVRKSAHFIMFLLLGIYAYLSADALKINKQVIVALAFCLMYGVSDEVHQLFVEGRSCEFTDVIIDFCGSMAGVFLILLLKKKFKKRGVV